MKSNRLETRVEPSVKRYLAAAAKRDRRSLSQFMVAAALERAAELMEKAPPTPKDCRKKATVKK